MENSAISWWVQPVINLVSIIIGALIIIWQIGKQFRNSLELQKRNLKDTLLLDIYKEFAKTIDRSNYAISAAMAKVADLPQKLETDHMMQTKLHMNPSPSEERAQSFSDIHYNAVKKTNTLVFLMEKYEIAVPNFQVFRRHFTEQFELLRNAFNAFYQEAVKHLPTDVSEKEANELGVNVIVPESPNKSQIDNLQELANNYQDECVKFLGYIMDLRIELQNNLLSSLFEHKIEHRKPKDHAFIVIRAEEGTEKHVKKN